jgi:predicted dehydrogenase
MHADHVSRRGFLSTSAVTAGAALASRGAALGQDEENKPVEVAENDKISIGMIGVGGRGRGHVAQLLKIPWAKITAICDIDATNLNSAVDMVERAQEHRPKMYDAGPEDYKNLLADKDIDAISSALPCDIHAQVYLDTIAAGKHIYGEKPMALTVADCNAIVAAQEKNPELVVQIGFQWRADPKNQELVKRVQEGQIGELYDFRGARSSRDIIGKPQEGPRVWLGRRARSGDWMLEQACHDWDLFNWFAGQKLPLRASGFGRRDLVKHIDPERDVTDYYKAIIEYPGGIVFDWLHNWQSPYRDKGVFSKGYRQVAGTKGAIDIDSGRIYPMTPNGSIDLVKPLGRDPSEESFAGFVDAVRNKKKPVSGVYNGRDAVLVGLLVRTAVDTKRTVTMEEILAQG